MTTKPAQFTPGPWRKGIDNTIYQSETNKRIADVFMHMIYRDSDAQAHANANLIAAAPAMYEALVRFAKAIKAECYDEDILVDIYHDVRDALAQAEGRQA